ncbi:MAG TPA: hypothetical protein VF657_01120 [Actinoplanes sp.]|jgi:hypothetical protein
MNDTIHAATRRFPLLGRPRPACPALPHRIQEVTDAVATAEHKPEHGLTDAAHALNKAALIASDCGMPDLAERICWQHIHAYRRLDRPLTVLEARYVLEPVLNLARLQIRADQGTTAVHLLETMYHAVTRREDLTIGDHVLPTADLTGEQHERRQLHEWVWLQLISEGVRALAGRWQAAAEHARTHNGIGVHLMEGRQAAIIAACLHDELSQARKLLTDSTPTEPWELEVAACLNLMCTRPGGANNERHLETALVHYRARGPMPGYASYRARLGLTIVTLSSHVRVDTAAALLRQVADEAIASLDGYAARDVLGSLEPTNRITDRQHAQLTAIATESGLGQPLPDPAKRQVVCATARAEAVLDAALKGAPARSRPDGCGAVASR